MEKKKNDVNYIIPASRFENVVVNVSPTTVPKVEIENPVVINEVIDQNSNVQESITAESESEYQKEPKKQIQNVDSENVNLPENNIPVITSAPSPAVSVSLEEKRKALFEKTKNKVSGLSIQGIEAKNSHIAQQEGKKVSYDKLPEEEFNQEQLTLVWNKYVEHLKDRGQLILASIINADQPVLEGTSIKLRFPNQSMKEDLEKSQGQILEYLKRELNNYLIDFKIAVDKSVTKKYVYTDQDKFSKLVEKNPAVDILRQAFDLDF